MTVQKILYYIRSHDRFVVPDGKPSYVAGEHQDEGPCPRVRSRCVRGGKSTHTVAEDGDVVRIKGAQIVVSGLSVLECVFQTVDPFASAGAAEGQAQYPVSVKTQHLCQVIIFVRPRNAGEKEKRALAGVSFVRLEQYALEFSLTAVYINVFSHNGIPFVTVIGFSGFSVL